MADIDWRVLEIEGVREVAERAATVVAREWDDLLDLEDLIQEAYVALATKPNEAIEAIELDKGGFKLLYHRLWCDLTDFAKKEHRRVHLNFSYDELTDETVDG